MQCTIHYRVPHLSQIATSTFSSRGNQSLHTHLERRLKDIGCVVVVLWDSTQSEHNGRTLWLRSVHFRLTQFHDDVPSFEMTPSPFSSYAALMALITARTNSASSTWTPADNLFSRPPQSKQSKQYQYQRIEFADRTRYLNGAMDFVRSPMREPVQCILVVVRALLATMSDADYLALLHSREV